MISIKEYVFGLFALSTLVAVVLPLITYRENTVVKFAVGVLVLYAATAPLGSIDFGINNSLSLPEVSGSAEYENVASEAIVEAVLNAVEEKFSLKKENMSIQLDGFDFKTMKAQKIVLTLRYSAILKNYDKIEKYVTSLGCGECEVKVEI